MVDMMRDGTLPNTGFVRQEEADLDKFLGTPTGKRWAAAYAKTGKHITIQFDVLIGLAVRVLVMLVHADAVEAERAGIGGDGPGAQRRGQQQIKPQRQSRRVPQAPSDPATPWGAPCG